MEKEGRKCEPPSGPLESQGRHKNAFGGDWLSHQFHQKIKDYYIVFVHQENVRKKKQKNFKINSVASFPFKIHDLRDSHANTFCS